MSEGHAALPGDEEKKVSGSKKKSSLFETSMVMSAKNGWITSHNSLKIFSAFLRILDPTLIEESINISLMTSMLLRYIIKKTVETAFPLPTTPVTEETLNQEIKKSNDIAVALQSIWWPFRRNKQPQDQDVSRATRLLLCQQMLDQFKYEANNPGSTLDEAAINRVYEKVLTNFNKQKEWWPGPFNKEIDQLKRDLLNVKQNYLSVREKRKDLETILSRYQGDAKTEPVAGSSEIPPIIIEASIQLAQILTDLQKLSEYKAPTAQSIINTESTEIRSQIAKFIASEKFALKHNLDKMQAQIAGKKFSKDDLETMHGLLLQLAANNNINQQLSAIAIMGPELQQPVASLKQQISTLTKTVENNIQELNAAKQRSKSPSPSSSHGSERKVHTPPLPSGLPQASTVVIPVEEKKIATIAASDSPTQLSSSSLFQPSSQPHSPKEKKQLKEKKQQSNLHAEYKKQANAIAYEAKKYIKARLDTTLTTAEELEDLFSAALDIVKKTEGTYSQVGEKIRTIKRLRTLDTEINKADARKIVALLSIYTAAQAYLNCGPDGNKEELYQSMQEKIKTAATDLCAADNYEHKYDRPEGYCTSMVAISIISGIYLSREIIASRKEEGRFYSDEELATRRKPYEHLFARHERPADALLRSLADAVDSPAPQHLRQQ